MARNTHVAVPLSRAWPTVKSLLEEAWFTRADGTRARAVNWSGRRIFATFAKRITSPRPDHIPTGTFVTRLPRINIFRATDTNPPIRLVIYDGIVRIEELIWEAGPQGWEMMSGTFLVNYVPAQVAGDRPGMPVAARYRKRMKVVETDKVEITVSDFETLSLLFYEKGRTGHAGSGYRAARALAAALMGARHTDRFGVEPTEDFNRRFDLMYYGPYWGYVRDGGEVPNELVPEWRVHVARIIKLLVGSMDGELVAAEMRRWQERGEREAFGKIPRL